MGFIGRQLKEEQEAIKIRFPPLRCLTPLLALTTSVRMQQTEEKGIAITAYASGKTDLYISTYQFIRPPQMELAAIVYSFAAKAWSQSKMPTLVQKGTKG